jgi:membrane protein
VHIRETFSKFFADRGTHLAAMIAYFALLSFVPLFFLALSLLGVTGRVDESSYLVTELKRLFPAASVDSIENWANGVRDNWPTLGLVGAAFLLWSSLSLFSVLESAFNIVYNRPNRPFLHGKARAFVFMIAGLVLLFVGLVVGAFGAHLLNRFAPGFLGNPEVSYVVSILVSAIGIFVFLASAYRYLPNADLSITEVLPGAILVTVALEATFQVLPFYLRLSKHVPVAQAVGGPVLLLIWLYVMSNMIVFGAEFNWRLAQPSTPRPRVPGASAPASTGRPARP